MTMPKLEAIGFCAHYSEQGDWAFDYALRLSQRHSLQLNVFHFLSDPYDPTEKTVKAAQSLSREELDRCAIEKERELRMYYDQRAGDYLDVGFRLCYDNSWKELHRCLAIHEFQLLVLGFVDFSSVFVQKPIEEFAKSFVCPVVLVGPDRPDQFRLNSQAAMVIDRLGIDDGSWRKVENCIG